MSLGCNLKEVKQNALKQVQELVKTKTISMDNNGVIKFEYNNSSVYTTRNQAYNVAKSVEKKIAKWAKENVGPKFTKDWTSLIQNANEVFLQFSIPKYVQNAYTKKFNDIELKKQQEEEAREVQRQDSERTGEDYNDDYLFEPLDYFSDPLFEANDIVIPNYEKYIQYKKNLIYRVESRLAQISRAKKENSNNTEVIKNLVKLENELKDRLEGHPEEGIQGLKDELKELESNPPIDKFLFYSEIDLKRLDSLSKSINEQDLKEAETIIRFYDKVGTFSTKEDNPIFSHKDMFSEDGTLILPKDVQEKLADLKDKVNGYRNKIYQREKKAIEDTINNLSKMKMTFEGKEFTYEELFMKEEGLKDIPWVDMFLMDITNGIFSTNGIVPQAIMNIVQNSFEGNLVYAKSIEHQVNTIQPEVEKELTKLGYDLKVPGLKGVSYDLFRAKNINGQYRDSIVQRYTEQFTQERSRMLSTFEDKLETAKGIEDPVKKTNAFSEAFQYRDNWYKKNTILFDIRKLSAVRELYPNNFIDDNGVHEQELKSILGESGFNEEVSKQLKLLKDYQTALEVYKDKLITDEGSSELSDKSKNKLSIWEKRNNPFILAESYYNNEPIMNGKLKLNSSMAFNYSIPRKNLATLKLNQEGNYDIIPDENESGYYDKNFELIESNKILKDFHNLLMEVNQKIFDVMPPDLRDKFNVNSFPQLRKSITEILFDPNLSFFQRVSKAAREMYERIMGMFGIKVQSNLSYANVDPITGLPEYKVNAEFLQSNKEEINKRFEIESLRLKKALGKSVVTKIGKYATYNWHSLPQQVIDLLQENLDPNTFNSIKGKENLEIFNILKDGITHQVVQEQSFDLPKMLKLFSYLAMEYQARQEVLPLVEMIKKHYEEIKNPSITNTGDSIINVNSNNTRLEGERKNAIRQMNSWFERVVVGDYSSKNEFGDGRIKRQGKLGLTGNQKVDAMTSKLQTTVTGRILTKEEKIIEQKILSLLDSVRKDMEHPATTTEDMSSLMKTESRLKNQLDTLGKRFTWTKALDAIFNFVRFKGLGWNLSSQTTNFLEGQIANFIASASGLYYTPENIYKANQIIQSSFLKNTSFGYIQTDNAKKVRILMDRYRILQDASNELQKASSKSAFSQFSKLSPFEMMKRVEYLNQSPLMIAILMDEVIIGKDGSKSNVWDETQPDGKLSDNFRTKENIKNWEEANGEKYNDFSSKVKKVIVNTHGDYDELRGNMASEYVTGKALLMFKRWMSRQIYNRFGVEQTDLETGLTDFKGRYRSHTTASGATHGAILGFGGLALLGSGPLGLIIGATAGTVIGKFYGANSGLGFIQESAIIGKELFLNILRMPVNSLTGKTIIKNADFKGLKLSEQDLRNYRANLTDMSLTLAFIALLLFTKALLWDDDDESESARRKAHNYFANKFMQLSSQASMYLNPVDMYANSVGNLPVLKFFNDVQETAKAGQKALEGDDIITAGPNAGESNLYNKASKAFLPGLFKAEVGFEGQMQKQFKPSPFDKWFQGEEKESKEEIKELKTKTKSKLITDDLPDEEKEKIEKELNKFFKKGKGETYTEALQRIDTELQFQEDSEE